MAIKEIRREWSACQLGYVCEFMLHTEKDVQDLPICCVGSVAHVSETNTDYVCTGKRWVLRAEEVVILAKTALSPVEGEEGIFTLSEPLSTSLSAGMICTVTYNGVEYECPVKAREFEGLEVMALGEVGNLDKPFEFVQFPPEIAQETGSYAYLYNYDGATTVTLSITAKNELVNESENAGAGAVSGGGGKYKQPEWGASTEIVDILPEATYEATEGAVALMEPPLHMLIEGGTYEVNYNGASHNCVCYALASGVDETIYMLGNAGAVEEGAPVTDDPFVVAIYEEDVSVAQGFWGAVAPLDGSTTITLSIKGPGGEIRTIPKEYVEPAPVAPLIIGPAGVLLPSGYFPIDTEIQDIRNAIISGRMVYFNYGGELFPLIGADIDFSNYTFGWKARASGVDLALEWFMVFESPAYGTCAEPLRFEIVKQTS